MSKIREFSTATEEDLTYGQQVIVSARWILVVTGLMLALWNPGPISELRIQILFILLLAVANFYLHAQLLMGRPPLSSVVYGASAADLTVITVMVLIGSGFDSNTFVFYYPAILAFSVAFPPVMTFFFAAGATGFYGLIGLATLDLSATDFQALVARMVMMVAIAVCGSMYWRIERNRRVAAVEAREKLMAQIGKKTPAKARSGA
jgi:hypothetical protein